MAEIKNIRIAISGIYDYAQEELASLRLDLPGTGKAKGIQEKRVYQVYRPSIVLERAKDKFKLLPLTHHHPQKPVDGKNFRKLAVGYTGENTYIDFLSDKNEVGIRSNLVLYDDESLEAYNRGEVQLSPGYVGVFEWQQGVSPNGQAYDIIMQEIETVNHLALLPAGRGGAEAIILDKSIETHKTVFELASERLQASDGDFKEDLHKRDKGGKFATSSEGKEKRGALEVLTKTEFSTFVEKHKTSKENVRVSLGNVSSEAKKRIKEKTNLDVKRVIVDSGSIRHAINNPVHNLKNDDLDDMFNLINTTNDIKLSKDTHKGNPVIIFRKEEKNGQYLLEEFRKRKGDLALLTAYRKKQQPQHDVIKNDPGNNVQNGTAPTDTIPDNAPKVNTIFSLIKNEKFTVFTLAKMTIGVTDI